MAHTIYRMWFTVWQAQFMKRIGVYQKLGVNPLLQSMSLTAADCKDILRAVRPYVLGSRTADAIRCKVQGHLKKGA